MFCGFSLAFCSCIVPTMYVQNKIEIFDTISVSRGVVRKTCRPAIMSRCSATNLCRVWGRTTHQLSAVSEQPRPSAAKPFDIFASLKAIYIADSLVERDRCLSDNIKLANIDIEPMMIDNYNCNHQSSGLVVECPPLHLESRASHTNDWSIFG